MMCIILVIVGVSMAGYEKSISSTTGEGGFTAILNIDFHDLIHCPFAGQFVGTRWRFYSPWDLEKLIYHAADHGFTRVNFRIAVCGKTSIPSTVKEQADITPIWVSTLKLYDPFGVAVAAARKAGIEIYAWLTPLDDAGPVYQGDTRRQSRFSMDNPFYQLLSKYGHDPLWGVYCFGYEEVVDYHLAHLNEILAYGADGVFFSTRTHSNIDERQIEYGFNEPVIERYKELYGGDPRDPDYYSLERFSQVQGDFFTEFLAAAAERVHNQGQKLQVAVSWQRNGRIANRLGGLHKDFYQWKRWVEEGIIDELVIGGDMATGNDPEHILPYIEVEADSANPEYFRSRLTWHIPIYRWLTLWSWGWPDDVSEVTSEPTRSFTDDVVSEMILKAQTSGLDGIILHEVVNIDTHGQWDTYKKLLKGQ